MNLEQIKTKVREHIDSACAGQSMEDLKFDFKFKWSNLNEAKSRNEFLKDITAMANTYGPDGFIVYGFDDKALTFENAVFADSGLRDKSDLNGLQSKYLSNPFDLNVYDITINEKLLTVIHFPPTLNKPILIKNYQTFHKDGKVKKEEQQKIFVRKDTSIQPASKYDLELMYYDRKNIIPEYNIQIALLSLRTKNTGAARALYSITIENTGRRPISINKIIFKVETKRADYRLTSSPQIISKNVSYRIANQYIRPNDIQYFSGEATFWTINDLSPRGMVVQIENGEDLVAELILTNGKILSAVVEIADRLGLDP